MVQLKRIKNNTTWAVVVAQLVERSLPTPEVCCSNPVIGKPYITYLLSTVLKWRKIKKKGRKWSNFESIYFDPIRSH